MGRGTYNGGSTVVGFRSGWFGNSPTAKKAKEKKAKAKKAKGFTNQQSLKKAANPEAKAAADTARREQLVKESEARKAARAARAADPAVISKVIHRQQMAAERMRKIVVERRRLKKPTGHSR